VLDGGKWIVEVMEQRAPLGIAGALAKADRVILDRLPRDEKKIAIRGLDAAPQLDAAKPVLDAISGRACRIASSNAASSPGRTFRTATSKIILPPCCPQRSAAVSSTQARAPGKGGAGAKRRLTGSDLARNVGVVVLRKEDRRAHDIS